MNVNRRERALVRIAQALGDPAANGLAVDSDGEVDDELILGLESVCAAWLERCGYDDPAARGWDRRAAVRNPPTGGKKK